MNFEITPLGEKLFKEYMDEWRQEGIEKGVKQGFEQGFKTAIAIQKLILKNPAWTDQQIADTLKILVSQVKKVRKELNE